MVALKWAVGDEFSWGQGPESNSAQKYREPRVTSFNNSLNVSGTN